MGAPFTVPRHKLSVDDYCKMGAVGILKEDSRIELIEGELIEMAPIGGKHMRAVNNLNRILVRQVGADAIVSPQNPVVVSDRNAPQPDLALLRPDYAGDLPTVPDILLVIEVADTTLAYDRGTKVPLYARHGIPEVWLFDVERQSVAIHLDPGPEGYRRVVTPDKAAVVSPSRLSSVAIKLSEVWR